MNLRRMSSRSDTISHRGRRIISARKRTGKACRSGRLEMGKWQTLPSWKGISLNDEYSFGSYRAFAFRYVPIAHQVFIIAYEKMWGVMYSEL